MSKTKSGITKDVLNSVEGELSSAGYKRRGTCSFVRPLCKGVSAVVGIGISTKHYLSISPHIGVRHESVENLLRKIAFNDSEHVDDDSSPTIALNIGYLSPKKRFRSWNIKTAEDVTPFVDELSRLLKRYCEAFFRKAQRLDWVQDRMLLSLSRIDKRNVFSLLGNVFPFCSMNSPVFTDTDLYMRLPIILILQNEVSLASDLMETHVKSLQGSSSKYAIEYRNFVCKFGDLKNADSE